MIVYGSIRSFFYSLFACFLWLWVELVGGVAFEMRDVGVRILCARHVMLYGVDVSKS